MSKNLPMSQDESCNPGMENTTTRYLKIERSAQNYQGPYNLSVSIIIPHYNSNKLLSRCVAGLSSQTYPKNLMEIIISDDGSDQIPALEELAYADLLNIKLISQTRLGRRTALARNRGIQTANGEVIICIDSHIIPVEDFIEAHMKYYHVANKITTLGPRKFIDTSNVNPKTIPTELSKLKYYPDIPSTSNHGYHLDGRIPFFKQFDRQDKPYWFYYSCNIAFKRETALRVGLFDDEFDGNWGYEDIEFGYRLFRDGNIFVCVMNALALHQEENRNSVKQRETEGEINMMKLIQKWPNLDNEEPETLPQD